jgi:hypothetical protein
MIYNRGMKWTLELYEKKPYVIYNPTIEFSSKVAQAMGKTLEIRLQ